MLTLGIESTCDETGCALVYKGKKILSNKIASQVATHARFGGVVPELACRQHIDQFLPLLNEALSEACVSLKEIDLISVARGPGLIGALLIGIHFAKGLAFSLKKPLVGVNHVEAHLFAATFEQEVIPLPAIGVVISGGHTQLVLIENFGTYKLIGQTQDDALGEAFDKVAAILGLPYPGGPNVEKMAKQGDPTRYKFKIGKLKERPYDFSFSGLKTAVLYLVKGQNSSRNSETILSPQECLDVAASFQRTALLEIVEKSSLALKQFGCKSLLLGGGVTANRELRRLLEEKELGVPIFFPPKELSLDNGAMIALLGYHNFINHKESSLEPMARLPFYL